MDVSNASNSAGSSTVKSCKFLDLFLLCLILQYTCVRARMLSAKYKSQNDDLALLSCYFRASTMFLNF